jgi:ribosomal-protein-alanine N-acetyltransferase
LVLFERGDEDLIGTCGYEVLKRGDKRGEIGCDLSRHCWGQGLMREALRAVIDYSFSGLGLHRIEAYVLADNARARRLLRNLGFRAEGVLRAHRLLRGEYRDAVVLSLLEQEWRPQA